MCAGDETDTDDKHKMSNAMLAINREVIVFSFRNFSLPNQRRNRAFRVARYAGAHLPRLFCPLTCRVSMRLTVARFPSRVQDGVQ